MNAAKQQSSKAADDPGVAACPWSFAALLICCFAAFLPACTHTAGGPPHRAGKLLIIGGGLRDDNEIVWRAFAEAAGREARIGVIPTASAVEDAGESTAEHIRTLLPDAKIDLIQIRHDSPERAMDAAYAARIEACNVLWFTGGDQSRITAAFRPPSGDTPAYHAARRVLARGGLVAGTSAGAAMMSDPMITGGSGRDALLRGAREGEDDPGVGIGQGMGFFPYGLTDQHFLRRARLGRLIVALHETDAPRGYGVADNRAILVDLAGGTIRTLGDDGLLLVDVSESERTAAAITNVRLSLFCGGRSIDARTGRARSSPWVLSGLSFQWRDPPEDPFAPDAVKQALYALLGAPGRTVSVGSEDGRVQFHFSADDQTGFVASGPEPLVLSVFSARLDIAMTPQP